MTGPTPEPAAYALWAVFRRDPSWRAEPQHDLADAVGDTVEVRGFYDVSGLRADADVLVWLVGRQAADLQQALRRLRRAAPFTSMAPVWNVMGVHRDAEFSPNHSPAYARGLAPKDWITVYPFVRSYEWYLLPDEQRRAMLAEHGGMGAEHRAVQANTVAAFALNDYEWILALEADDPIELVDLMRHLRQAEARRHVREEVPFFTGRRVEAAELAELIA
ncbi:chlorite dismutase family protein [Pseudolysinimonas kribbensis]|uniref:hydrogen peroxide-dependent heme synthase n=1 Tax=Pseudolysinimonas kribbensis TaxID=433641 RepID=UPI0031D872E3